MACVVLAHCYAIFLCSCDVEIVDSLVGQLTSVVPQIGIIKHLDPLSMLKRWSFYTRLHLHIT